MILLVGQVPRAFRGREAWQELDYAQVFGGIAKAAWELDSAERIPEHMAEAYSIALSGRPGPVVLALPEDVLAEEADVADGARVEAPRVAPGADDIAAAAGAPRSRRASARRRRRRRLDGRDEPRRAGVLRGERASGRVRVPLSGLRRQPLAELRRRARRRDGRGDRGVGFATPTSCSRSAVGSERCRRAGTRSSRRRDPRQTLVHVHPDPGELGRVYEPDLAIAATLPEFAAALRALAPIEPRWHDWTRRARADYEANPRARADGGRRRPRRDHGVPAEAASRRRDPDVRRRQLHRLGAPLRPVHAVRDAGVPAQRVDGLRAPGRGRRTADPPGARSSSASRVTATSS